MPHHRSHRAHAAVLGSGIAGLAAAGALAPLCERITVFERDDPPAECGPRKGVPQGRHGHILLMDGENALAETFPGLVAELEARGSCRVNFGSELRWFHHGVWKVPYDSRLIVHMQSRPFLEAILRERLAGLGNVKFRYRTAAHELDVEGGRATAVRVREAEGPEETAAADLIVDATGRGSSLVRLLAAHGYPAPREERLALDIQYSSRLYRPRPGSQQPWKALLVAQTPPAKRRLGLVFPVEDGRWIVSLGGYLGEHPPANEEGFLDFARSLEQPDLLAALRDAEPLSEIQALRFPTARWTRFERLSRFPAGLLPVGDTVCSFDPVFGQGMSVAARGARLLAAHVDRDPRAGDPKPYLRALARVVAVPWLLTSSEDLRYAGVEGRRPFWLPWLQRYTHRVFRLTGASAPDYDRLLRVLHLLARPPLLFHPATLARAVGRTAR
ncbi:MAG: hypothetical protein JF614_05300 [Acidobacteria bacterium]|nr:hypothetical protein [Acidobacteriota bacterium]